MYIAQKIVQPVLDKTTEIDDIPTHNTIYCSCVKTVRALGIAIPLGMDADKFVPNTTPHTAAVVIFKFPDNIFHVAYIDKVTAEGLYIHQGNKERCKYTEEWIAWDNPYIIGFWEVM